LLVTVEDETKLADRLMLLVVALDVSRLTCGTEPVVTLTLADLFTDPPVPVQVRVYVALLVGETLWLPEVLLEPVQLPEAVQEVAFVVLQVRLEDCPLVIEVGVAARVKVGAGVAAVTVTLADLFTDPPVPVQVRV